MIYYKELKKELERLHGKRAGLALLAAALTLLLSGCFVKTVDELYTLPRHSDEYDRLELAIDAVLSGQSAVYSAPVSGPNQQSVQLADLDGDGRADLQLVAEYPFKPTDEVWPNGHYMIVLDTDRDDIFNYIDWNTFRLECWQKSGICDFFPDYSGKTAFMKMHASTDKIGDLRLNWENPFLFYDPDKDGLTEMAIRLLDSPPHMKDPKLPNTYDHMQLTGRIDWVSIAVDLDNDNRPGQEFDFDFTLGFQGEGFDYGDQVHPLRNMRGLPEADRFFPDPRFRQLTELVYTDHEHAYDLIFKRGKWSRVNFVFDEDDDCGRWERVEFCDNLDPFKVGRSRGGFDNHSQSDPSGDRGEWDMDNSGGGRLYIGRNSLLPSSIHLLRLGTAAFHHCAGSWLDPDCRLKRQMIGGQRIRLALKYAFKAYRWRRRKKRAARKRLKQQNNRT